MKYVEFEVGTKREWTDTGTIEVVKKTPHFTTFRIVGENSFGEVLDFTFRRKEQVMFKDNGWLSPSTRTMGVNWRGVEIYACDFKKEKEEGNEMEKTLNIKQLIFAEFIRLELIEQAIEYAKDAKLSDEEQQEALRNKSIERMNELLKNVEPLKFSLEISTNQDEIDFLRNEIKAQYVEINELREKLNLVRGEK